MIRFKILFWVINLLFVSNCIDIQTQTIDNKIAKNWHFGQNIAINFDLYRINQDTTIIKADEGSCSISDNSGKLLFYTNGTKLYNFKHQLIENGDSLLGHNSSTQSALALKLPNSPNIYYLFTVTNIGRTFGFNYSKIDMNENNGLGKVINKNIKLDSMVTERLAATLSYNQEDYWISVRRWKSNEIASYLLTKNGLEINPIISPIAKNLGNLNSLYTLGQMKFSPNGNKLAIATFGSNYIELFDFDKKNGKFSNPILISNSELSGPYGLEFSPNSNYLYASYQIKTSKIVQFDISNYDSISINNNYQIIAIHPDNYYFGSLQLSPNYKIIIANNEEKSIGMINFPNRIGEKCEFIPQVFKFENEICKLGLPSFESNIFANYNDSEFSLVDDNKIEDNLINLVADSFIEEKNNNSLSNNKDKNLLIHTDKEFQKGAVWTKNKVKLDKFETFFKIKLSKGNNKLILDGSAEGADGFAFVIQNESNKVIGENAAGIGYSGIPKSLTIEFDCFNNNTGNEEIGDPNGNHIAIMSTGKFANSSKHNYINNLVTVNFDEEFYSDNNHYFGKISYVGNELKVYLDSKSLFDKPVITYKINLDSLLELIENKAYIGFTASTGNAVEECELVKWTLYNDSSFVSTVESYIDLSNKDSKLLSFNNISISKEVLKFNLSKIKPENITSYITDLEFYDYLGKRIFQQNDINLNIGENIIKISEKFINLPNPIFINFNIKETNEVYNFKLLMNY